MSKYLEIRNLVKKYPKVKGLDDISFSCAEGSFTVLLGPSGAGKTTTVNIIAGILQETSGDILCRGASLRGIPPQDRKISMVFEDYALYPTFSVYENIASPLRARKLSQAEIDERVKHMANLLGIEGHLDKLPSQISGGQKQRTALARCLIHDADIYLLDEPIAHLDAKLRHRMRGEFKRIHKELGKTMIYVTHDYREALALADNIVVLNKGKIVQIGSPDELFSHPKTIFVATLLGEPPMNLLEFEDSNPVNGGIALIRKETRIIIKGVNPVSGKVILGFRDFTASLQQEADENFLEGTVYVSELVEDSRVFSIMVGDDLVKVLASRNLQLEINQHVYIKLDPQALHFFDGTTGERIATRL